MTMINDSATLSIHTNPEGAAMFWFEFLRKVSCIFRFCSEHHHDELPRCDTLYQLCTL